MLKGFSVLQAISALGSANSVLYLDANKTATAGTALGFNGTTLNFGGTATRLTADTTGATINDRFAFVTNQANSTTRFNVAPSGTGVASSINVFNNSNLNNAAAGALIASSTAVTLSSGVTGTGTALPLSITTAGVERARYDVLGNVIAGGSVALATTATDGFLYVPTCAGTPTGTPTAITGMVPIVVDTTNNKFYFYSNAAWRDAGP
jgi:hypothetical protein